MTKLIPLVVFALWAGAAQAHEHAGHGAASPEGCSPARTALRCAAQVTPAMAPDGALHLAWVAGGRVMAARSDDGGRSFAPAIAVNPRPETIDANGEARPAVAADGRGRVVVAYAIRSDKGYAGTLMLARSADGGRTFAPPRRVTADSTSQRFPSLIFAPSGRLLLAWVEKRGANPKHAGVMTAWSDDGGATLSGEKVLATRSCECCRVALAPDPRGTAQALWRQIAPPNIRDHVIAALAEDGSRGPIRPVADDDWRIDACPHHGPALAVDSSGTSHAAWYTAGNRRKGLFYAHGEGAGAFSAPHAIGTPDNTPSHPQVLDLGDRLWLAWKEYDGTLTRVIAQVSRDRGATWSAPAALAGTADASDHPLLLADAQRRGYLSWATRAEGWRLLPLPGSGS